MLSIHIKKALCFAFMISLTTSIAAEPWTTKQIVYTSVATTLGTIAGLLVLKKLVLPISFFCLAAYVKLAPDCMFPWRRTNPPQEKGWSETLHDWIDVSKEIAKDIFTF